MPVIPTNSVQTNNPLHIPILYYVSTFTIALFLNVQLLCDLNRSSKISPSYNNFFNCTSEFSILFQFILMKKFCPVKASSHFFYYYYVNQILATLLNHFCSVILIKAAF